AANNEVTITDDPQKVQYDLQAILTHEAGHFIGIAHSPDANAVMYASYNPGSTTQRTLTDDDIGVVCEIYPPNSGVACNTEPRGGFSATCDDPTKSGLCSAAPTATASANGMIGICLAGIAVAGAALGRRFRSAS